MPATTPWSHLERHAPRRLALFPFHFRFLRTSSSARLCVQKDRRSRPVGGPGSVTLWRTASRPARRVTFGACGASRRCVRHASAAATCSRIQSVNLDIRVETPGRLGSAQPMPQLMIPARNQRPSFPRTCSGPPESPCGKIDTLVRSGHWGQSSY